MDAAAADSAAAAAAAAAATRHSGRERKVSKALARVDGEARRTATAARLEAWELDNAAEADGAEDSDEYVEELEDGACPRRPLPAGG